MNRSSLAVFGALVLTVGFIMMASPVLADWNQGDFAKWAQLPDLTSDRVGVLTGPVPSALNRVVADDFKCTGTGPITGIHIWASYFDDATWNLPYTNFRLSIWDDEPAAGQNPFSHPRERLWSMEFKAGEYKLRQYATNLTDGYFFDPLPTPYYLVSEEKEVWQFNFSIPAEEAFKQTEGNIYWLSVEVLNDIHLLAWQSARFDQRWNDDAVWALLLPGTSPDWEPLEYLAAHGNPNYRGESMDMAFVITPIPGSLLLLGSGLLGLAGLGWRFRK